MNKYDIYNKAIKVIDSCEGESQLHVTGRYARLASKFLRDDYFLKNDIQHFLARKIFEHQYGYDVDMYERSERRARIYIES